MLSKLDFFFQDHMRIKKRKLSSLFSNIFSINFIHETD
jgi:hypothetical protein